MRLHSETHAHADHLTSSQYLKSQLGGTVPVCIGTRIDLVQKTFASVYGFDDPTLFQNAFDIYMQDEHEFSLGDVTCRVVHLPGHTPDHIGYVFGGAIFTGDSIFNVRLLYPLPFVTSRLRDAAPRSLTLGLRVQTFLAATRRTSTP